MDYPEVCNKHKFNDARTRINHTTNTNTVEIYNWSFFFTKKNQVDPEAEFERVFLLLRTCTNPASGRST